MPHIKCVVVEDSDFFNRVITKYVNRILEDLKTSFRFTYSVNSYTSWKDCLTNIETDTDLVLADFYLGNNFKATQLMEDLQKKNVHSKVVVISQYQTVHTEDMSIMSGAYDFFAKDQELMQKCADLIYSLVEQKTSGLRN